MSLYLSIIGESKKNEGLDSTTFTLKDGTRKTIIVKATSFYNPNDNVSGNGIKLIFLVDNKRIGIANISGIDTDMPFMYDFEVNEKYRGQGYGSAILDYYIKKYKVNDLSVSPSNKNAISLYKKHGFKKRFDYKDGKETLTYMQIHKRGYEDR